MSLFGEKRTAFDRLIDRAFDYMTAAEDDMDRRERAKEAADIVALFVGPLRQAAAIAAAAEAAPDAAPHVDVTTTEPDDDTFGLPPMSQRQRSRHIADVQARGASIAGALRGSNGAADRS